MKTRKRIALLLTFLCFLLAACGTNGKPASTPGTASPDTSAKPDEPSQTEAVKEEPANITLYPASANLTSGIVGGWRGDWIAENYTFFLLILHTDILSFTYYFVFKNKNLSIYKLYMNFRSKCN